MTENQTTLQTPSGKELIIKNKLNAGERNSLRRVMFGAFKMEINNDPAPMGSEQTGAKVVPKEMDPEFIEKRERALIEISVIKYGDLTTGFYEALLAEDPNEYDFVVTEIDKAFTAGNVNFF